MFLLSGDVITDDFSVGRADGERAITFLPSKGTILNFVMYPLRRHRLDVAKHVGKAGGSRQAEEDVYMIGHATYYFWYRA